MHRESGADALAAVDLDRATMKFEHHGNQMKTDAAAGDTDRVGTAEVALEQVRTIAFRYSDAAIAYANRDVLPGVAVRRDLDRVARRGILQGIGQEVAEQCEQQFSISVHDARQLAQVL